MTDPLNPEEVEARVLQLLDDGSSMTLGLTTEDSDYNIDFVRQKLALCSTYLERLSDISMKLTRISVEVTRAARGVSQTLKIRMNQLKATDGYREQSREQKTPWLLSATRGEQEAAERWNGLRSVVSEVKDAIGERAQTMKRLDSDLRLHSKLIELAPQEGRGATSPRSYTGSSASEIDI